MSFLKLKQNPYIQMQTKRSLSSCKNKSARVQNPYLDHKAFSPKYDPKDVKFQIKWQNYERKYKEFLCHKRLLNEQQKALTSRSNSFSQITSIKEPYRRDQSIWKKREKWEIKRQKQNQKQYTDNEYINYRSFMDTLSRDELKQILNQKTKRNTQNNEEQPKFTREVYLQAQTIENEVTIEKMKKQEVNEQPQKQKKQSEKQNIIVLQKPSEKYDNIDFKIKQPTNHLLKLNFGFMKQEKCRDYRIKKSQTTTTCSKKKFLSLMSQVVQKTKKQNR